MALNIKNERVCRLAKQAAAVSGLSQTSVLEKALEAYLAEHERETQVAERRRKAEALLAEIRARVTDEDREWTRRFMEDLYDENGLPK